MARVTYSPQALEDIKEHFEYRKDYSDKAASRFAEHLITIISQFAHFGELGRSREELATGLRSFPVNRLKVTVFYFPSPHTTGLPLIARVLRQERDISPEMFAGPAWK